MNKFSVCALLLALGASAASKEIEAFSKSHVSPDVIPVAPSHLLKVEYKKSEKGVALGNELAPKDVREEPTVSYTGESDALYTLIMTDPDAPSRQKPSSREFNHWLVGNIPGSDVAKGEVVNAYVGSGPPKNTGLHRYVFLLYKQPGKIAFDEERKDNTDGNRGKFSAKNFAEKYKLGNPVAGNYFEAQYDESVPALHKQLGFR